MFAPLLLILLITCTLMLFASWAYESMSYWVSVRQPSNPQIRVGRRLAECDQAGEVLRINGALGCNLVVMGSCDETGLGRFWTCGVSEEILLKSACPESVVRTPRRAKPDTKGETTANPGDLVDVRPLGTSLSSAHTRKLVHTATVEIVRLIVRAGQEILQNTSKGEMIMHCLEGRVAVTAFGKTKVLERGKLMALPASEHYELKGVKDASLLLTILVPRR